MSDLERKAEEVGRKVWPDPSVARQRLAHRRRVRRVLVGRTGRPSSAAIGTTAVLALAASATAFIFAGHPGLGSSGTPPSGSAGAQAGRLVAGQSGASATGLAATQPATSAPTGVAGHASPAGSRHLPSPPFTPLPSPGVQPGPVGGVLTLTRSSRGDFPVRAGTTVVVDLSGVGWTMPSSSNGQVVRFERGSAMPNGDVFARFVVLATGEAKIQASESLSSGPAVLWQVQLTASP
ncbi:MAG: hypothetical protein M3R48_00780 [Candidatus Dormibacteraeota bacterium]|nr:hypothetical protein [Candidatus Dormibacteraeota bacterium]